MAFLTVLAKLWIRPYQTGLLNMSISEQLWGWHSNWLGLSQMSTLHASVCKMESGTWTLLETDKKMILQWKPRHLFQHKEGNWYLVEENSEISQSIFQVWIISSLWESILYFFPIKNVCLPPYHHHLGKFGLVSVVDFLVKGRCPRCLGFSGQSYLCCCFMLSSVILYNQVGDGQGSLACCSPWGHKESDLTEWLNWTELSLMNRAQNRHGRRSITVVSIYILQLSTQLLMEERP